MNLKAPKGNCTPDMEAERLATLQRYDVLDSEPEEAFDRITRLAKTALQIPIVLVSLVDINRQWFKSKQGLHVSETARDISFCTHAIKQDAPFIVRDALEDERFRENPLVTGEPKIRFYVGIPLTTHDGYNIGTLCAIDRKPRDVSDSDISLLRDLAHIVMDELELRRVATTDSLTGALTRRGFCPDVQREIDRRARYGGTSSVVVFDLDHFKSINDQYGHNGGDAVLRNVATTCKSSLRSIDLFARLGGEEFAVLLPDTDRFGAMDVAEKLRKAIADSPTRYAGRKIKATASFGATMLSHKDRRADIALDRADQALYRAKDAGRNRIAYADKEKGLSGFLFACATKVSSAARALAPHGRRGDGPKKLETATR